MLTHSFPGTYYTVEILENKLEYFHSFILRSTKERSLLNPASSNCIVQNITDDKSHDELEF